MDNLFLKTFIKEIPFVPEEFFFLYNPFFQEIYLNMGTRSLWFKFIFLNLSLSQFTLGLGCCHSYFSKIMVIKSFLFLLPPF